MSEKDLQFGDWRKEIENNLGKAEWITVASRSSAHKDIDQGGFYSAFISNKLNGKAIESYQWDLTIDGGFPSLISHYKNGKERIEYQRYPDKGIEPIVYWRSFYGIREDYYEISEEFRLYFNLFEDYKNNKFIYIDANGDEDDVIRIYKDKVEIKLKYLKEFLSAKKMFLAIFFDLMRFSEKSLVDLNLEEIDDVKKGENYIYSICVRNLPIRLSEKEQVQGWLMGKKIITGLTKFRPVLHERSDDKIYEEFIIGIDKDGREILHTCNEEKLANFFGKNPESPQFITPIFFRREVLRKYYDNPQKYSVEDGHLSCQGLWGLRLDNNHPEYVMVFLGDLGRLHHKEQLYWKSFNIASGEISHTAWKRAFEGEFTDPEQADLYFKMKYNILQKKWLERFGWSLFKPLSEEDLHHFESLHIPTTNGQKEFDDQVLSLTKIMIDSLNEKELEKNVEIQKEKPKGIDKFEAYLNTNRGKYPDMIIFLRNLQSLRSTSVAHRKSKNKKDYQKVIEYFDLKNKELSEVFEEILVKAILTLNTLEKHFFAEDDLDG